MDRRDFLHTAGFLALGTLVPALAANSCDRKMKDIGVQLYTVRDAMGTDAAAALRQVADIGFTLVEGAGYSKGTFYGRPPAEFRSLLQEYGLRMPSGHAGLDAFMDDPVQLVKASKAAGQEYVVLPWLLPEQRTEELYRTLPALLNTVGRIGREEGVRVAYHNHDFEFEPLPDGSLPMDLILEETDPELVDIELDIYWVNRAGKDPADYFRRYPGRFSLWHVKDMEATAEQFFAPVGKGVIDWPAVFSLREQAGLNYFFVEQDQTRNQSPFEAIRDSYTYLRSLQS